MRLRCRLSCLFLFLTVCLASARTPFRVSDTIRAAQFDLPMRIAPVLSANFGELRANHFHSGLDFKTQGVIGKNVYAVEEGWVSRISVTRYGYGKALYIDHPNGYTSVYGHLSQFAPRIDSVLKAAQYESQSYFQQLYFQPGEIPVGRGEKVAESGNTGGSGGPHLHFEIRETKTEEPMDPLLWYADRVIDREKPQIYALAVYDFAHSDMPEPRVFEQFSDSLEIPVWGRVGLGLKAYDRMTDTRNIYGIQHLQLEVDGKTVFSQDLSRYSFDESRYINALTDYRLWVRGKTWFMKSFREPGNYLNVYPKLVGDGYLEIDEERRYEVVYTLTDRHGNQTRLEFRLRGERPQCRFVSEATAEFSVVSDSRRAIRMYPEYGGHYSSWDVQVSLGPGSLYSPIDFRCTPKPFRPSSEAPRSYAPVYDVHTREVPLHRPITMLLRITEDVVGDPSRYYVAQYGDKGKWEYVGGTYEQGFISVRSTSFGSFTVLADSLPPKIIVPHIENAAKNDLIRILVQDAQSGVADCRCLIDGRWVLAEDDYKNDSFLVPLDERSIVPTGGEHRLCVMARDACGNQKQAEYMFHY